MDRLKIRNSLLLLLTAAIWGVAFVAQSVGMEYVEPFTFNCVRSLLGGLVLIPCIWLLNRFGGQKKHPAADLRCRRKEWKTLVLGGILCGTMLCLGSNLQQFGIRYTTVGKAGFITAFYIIIVPVLGLFLHRKCGITVWLGVLFALAGLYFLCITDAASQGETERLLAWLPVGKGEVLLLIGALAFSLHILVIDYFTARADGVKMSCIQFFVCGFISGVGMIFTEEPRITAVFSAWQPILYAGVMSCGVAYTLQIVGQKGMNPTVASLILSLESVISVLAGMVLLSQKPSSREVLGCVLMFLAIILAQLPGKKMRAER
ncbi:DMT family transporter [Lachnospiraceae bacterium]|nr:DMT family transporter [Lachnospiraceae bacterium]